MRISIFGLGYVGAVCAACQADAGHEVIGVDVSLIKVDLTNQGRSPVVEPGLEDIMQRQAQAGRLRATTDTAEAVLSSDLTMICVVSGIGNMWAAEALWATRLSPWLRVAEAGDAELTGLLVEAHRSMSSALSGARGPRRAYRRAGRPCRRCGTPITSRAQGEANRTAYWCPSCQA